MFGGVFNIESINSLVQIYFGFCENNNGYSTISKVGGGSVLMLKGDFTTEVKTSNIIFLDCLNSLPDKIDSKGAVIQYSGISSDFNSSFIANRKGVGASATYLGNFAKAHYVSTKFIFNFAYKIGGSVGITHRCEIIFQDSLFLGSSSNMGGVMSLNERSSLIINNSNFTNNSGVTGGVIHCIENYDINITVLNSYFSGNIAKDNLFNLIKITLNIFKCLFTDNENTMFFLEGSQLFLSQINISLQLCSNNIIGCLVNSIQNSYIIAETIYLDNIYNSLNEGNIYLEYSNGLFSNLYMNYVGAAKSKGCCLDILNSNISINNSSFLNYEINCIYGSFSVIALTNSYFDNKELISIEFTKNDNDLLYGTFFCENCLFTNISKNFFLNNLMGDIGGSITVINSYNINDAIAVFDISNSTFFNNKAIQEGGAIYLENAPGNINNCTFEKNVAKYGGAMIIKSGWAPLKK